MDTPLTPLFPPLEPYATHTLNVGSGHTLWLAEYGNPAGIPILVLHGGPGSGCSPSAPQRFNPSIYRIVLHDQRGAGRSTCTGDYLAHNTTADLLGDINRIRTHLNLGPVALYGTSWGSTLALAYAQAHPQQVLGLVVGGIFLCDANSFDWLTHPMGLPQLLPMAFARVQAHAPHTQGHRLIQAIYELGGHAITDLMYYESMAANLIPQPAETLAHLATPDGVRGARIETYYLANRCFLTEGQLLAGCPRIAHLPIFIVQGALDLVCPPAGAHRLHHALPGSTLALVPGSGHMSTPELDSARVVATNALAKIIQK